MATMSRKKLRRATLPPPDFSAEDRLLREARRLSRAAALFRDSPAASRPAGARMALMDELTTLLAGLLQAKAAIGEKLHRRNRATGALNAYARAGGSGRR